MSQFDMAPRSDSAEISESIDFHRGEALPSSLDDVCQRRRTRWVAVSLVALAAAAYWPTVGYEFVNWDDPWYVVHNEHIRSWHPANLVAIATQVMVKNYAPVTIFSYLVDHTLWGEWAGGYHLTNLVLHAVNVVLVFLFVRQLSGNAWVGWMTAAFFAVHPVHIESVAWVSSRKGLLSAGFILGALICWLRPSRTPQQEVGGLLWYFLALTSKAIAVVVPAVVFLYDVLIARRPWREAAGRQFIPACLAAWLLFMTMSAQTTEYGGVRGHFELSKAHILAVDSIIVWQYVGMLVWPHDLCILYDPPTRGIAGAVVLAAAGWLVVGAAAWRLRRRRPWMLMGLLTFWLFLLPVLNLFPITTLMNDCYLYLPSIPLFALASQGFVSCAMRFGRSWQGTIINPRSAACLRGLAGAPVLVALVALFLATGDHLPVWKDKFSLWRHTMSYAPQLPVVQIQYANTLHSVGRDREAVSVLQQALANCQPDEADRKRMLAKIADWQR